MGDGWDIGPYEYNPEFIEPVKRKTPNLSFKLFSFSNPRGLETKTDFLALNKFVVYSLAGQKFNLKRLKDSGIYFVLDNKRLVKILMLK